MSRFLAVLVIAGLALSCQPKPKTTVSASGPAPQLVSELTNQTMVYECPNCLMDFAGPGQCPMDHIDLVKTGIAYICPADNKPVEHSGRCPRCAANATITRTALAPAVPKALTGD